MAEDKRDGETPRPEPHVLEPSQSTERPGAQATAFNTALATLGIAVVVFVIGVIVGFPLATFGVEFFTQNAGAVFGVFFGFFVLILIIAGTLMIFRRSIWQSLFKRGEIEMERFAKPLANVARFAAQQKVSEATDSARDLAELVLARYAWISTRRWLMATITAFIAAIAALAGAALLFQQNQLLRVQIGLMEDQNARIGEQNDFIQAQIQLGEAQRSTAIVPEILDIGSQLGAETTLLSKDGRPAPMFFADEISQSLRARLVAASNAARPYRYLRSSLIGASDSALIATALERRTDLSKAREIVANARAAEGNYGVGPDGLTDRPVSPERGQLISMLFNARVLDTELLTFFGADFSFAEVRLPTMSSMSFQMGLMRYADFSGVTMGDMKFGGSFIENSRFHRAIIRNSSFAAVPNAEMPKPYKPEPGVESWPVHMNGADFSGAVITTTPFRLANGLGMNFDSALLSEIDFTNANLGGATFRGAILEKVTFDGTFLKSADFDGAVVFDPDFLSKVAAAAVKPDGFDASHFAIAPMTKEELYAMPQYEFLDYISGGYDRTAYRVTLAKPFD